MSINISNTADTGERLNFFPALCNYSVFFFSTAAVIRSLRVFLVLGNSSHAIYLPYEYNPAVSTVTFIAPKA